LPPQPEQQLRNPAPNSFHAEVVRSTKDLDARIAEAGVTGTSEGAHRIPDNLPPAPDTPEGAGAEAWAAERKYR
jgi:hypothetical protein